MGNWGWHCFTAHGNFQERIKKRANSVKTPRDVMSPWHPGRSSTLQQTSIEHHGTMWVKGQWLSSSVFYVFHSYYQASGVLQSGLQGRSAGTDLWPVGGPQTVLWQFSQGEMKTHGASLETIKASLSLSRGMKHVFKSGWISTFSLIHLSVLPSKTEMSRQCNEVVLK